MATTAKVSVSRKTVRPVRHARKESSIVRALRKVARLGASAGRRAKTAARRLARMAKAAALKAAYAVKRVAQKVARMAAPVARTLAKPFQVAMRAARKGYRSVVDSKLGDVARSVWAKVSGTWRQVLRPFLKQWGILLGTVSWLVSLAVAPVTTAAFTAGVGLLTIALSKGVGWLEQSKSKLALITRNVLEGIAQAMRVGLYIATGMSVALLAAVSLPFGVLFATELALRTIDWWPFERMGSALLDGVVEGMTGETLEPAFAGVSVPSRIRTRAEREQEAAQVRVRSRAQARTMDVEVVSRKPAPRVDVTPAMAPNNPETWTRGNFLVAKGTEELWGTEHDVNPALVVHDDVDEGRAVPVTSWDETFVNDKACDACGTTKGAMRIRSCNVPFVADGMVTAKTEDMLEHPDVLCSACFHAECEEVAMALTGVSLEARNRMIRLNKAGIEHSPQHAASLFEPTKFHWLESAWYRDGEDKQTPREWACLLEGKEVGLVVEDYRRGVFRASLSGALIRNGVKKTREEAQRVVEDEWSDTAKRPEEVVEVTTAEPARRRSKKG
jgi:hypothetical protein